jgi:hypothetical protein
MGLGGALERDVTPAAPKTLSPVALKKALQEFSANGIDEQKIRACLGHDQPWTSEELNGAWTALIPGEV